MSKKEIAKQPVQPVDDHDHSHPLLPLILVAVRALAILRLVLGGIQSDLIGIRVKNPSRIIVFCR